MSVIDRAIKAMRDTGLDCESWPDDVLEILVQAVLASTGAGELWQYVAIAEELDAQAKEIYVAPQPIRSEEFARIRAETIRGIALRASRIRESRRNPGHRATASSVTQPRREAL